MLNASFSRHCRVGIVTLLLALIGACSADMPRAAIAAPFHLQEASIGDIQNAIVSGNLSSESLVELYLQRIKAYNGTCVSQPEGILGPIATIPHAGQINALSTLNLRPATRKAWGFDARKARSMTAVADDDPDMPDALEVAAAQDAYFAKTGKLVGPLHGVVMAIKDQYDTYDMRTTSGAAAFYANDRPPDDATFVKRLREAGAIIIAKANLGEYASAIPRSSFGGTFCNPYDTERGPRGSSSGSGSSVAANLVTCAIAEESGSSIRGPASANNVVGIAATEELVSRDGMIQQGINTRVGPICRNVEDTAKVLDVIAGYDPADELTAFTIGRMPEAPYPRYAKPGRLDGLRIGVLREYMNKSLFTEADAESIDIVDRGIHELAELGATIIDPGPEGALFQSCVDRYYPQLQDKQFTSQYPDLFPVDDGKPAADHIATLIDMAEDTALVPDGLNLREFPRVQAEGQAKYWLNRYLRERGDTAIRTNTDLITKAEFHDDPNFPDRRESRERTDEAMRLAMAQRLQMRFTVQQIVMQCMAEQGLDALVYPTSNLPPAKLGAPRGPRVNGRSGGGVWTFIGAQGFPAITVPAGFTSEVYDLVRDSSLPKDEDGEAGTRLTGPTPAILPVGIDFMGRPFSEPTLFRIASAYEAATRHRAPPPDFGPVENEP